MYNSILEQGLNSSKVFGGKGKLEASKLLYTETPNFFANLISNRLKPDNYTLVDLGSFKGEFLSNVLKLLKGYSFSKIGVDVNESALNENNSIDKKVVADIAKIPINDNISDLTLGRYILVWNPWKKQKNIFDEIARITKGFAIIQHAGADSETAEEWRNTFKKLFDGKQISKLKRTKYFFSSRAEIETYMKEKGIKFERVQERIVYDFVDTLAERFQLNSIEHSLAKKLVGKQNYIIQNTWIIYGNN